MKRLGIALSIAIAASCFGCASPAVDDATISTKVKTKLAADTETSAIKIGVETVAGVVTLTGTVPTEREKGKAEEIARKTEDVKRVDNKITVDTNSLGATNVGQKAEEAVTDATILTKVKTKLLAEGIVGTNVDVDHGKVTLKGEVESAKEKTQAVDIAKATDGVTSVVNQLTVKKG